MGFGGIGNSIIGACVAASMFAGCGALGDPAAPCETVRFKAARSGTVVTPAGAPVVVVTAQTPYILFDDDGCDGCRDQERLDVLPGSKVLVTSTGRYAVALVGTTVGAKTITSFEILSEPAPAVDPSDPPTRIRKLPGGSSYRHDRLVAAMRGSDWVVTRNADGKLGRYLPEQGQSARIAQDLDGLNVLAVAFGEQYLLARQIHGADRESLFLIPVDPEAAGRKSIRLMTGPPLSRALLTPGDGLVVATMGEGASAETLILSVPDGAVVGGFSGAVVSGARRHEELPGLRGVSPDGTRLAFRTQTGALAMRDLELQSSCLVRSSAAGDHRLAGFAANGVLYAEAALDIGQTQLLAFDPQTRDLVTLGESDTAYHLAAVAASMPGDARRADPGQDGYLGQHWAIAVNAGSYTAVSSDGPDAPLGLAGVSFMAREDEGIWLLEARGSTNDRMLSVRRIAPELDEAWLRFKDHAQLDAPLVQTSLAATPDVCVSTGIPGAWAYKCNGGNVRGDYFSANSGQSEDPEIPDDPIEPVLPGDEDDG